MDVSSKYCKVFVSNGMTRQKYNELLQLAMSIREQKNKVSELVCSNLLKYLDMKPLNFVTEMRSIFKGEISSNFDKHTYQQVIDMYSNKFDALQRKLTFEHIEYQGVELYKRNCKGHRKGEFKKVVTKMSSTPLSVCLTYLARYGNETTLEYIKKQLERTDLKQSQFQFYKNILDKCDKFGFERLLDIALRIIKMCAVK